MRGRVFVADGVLRDEARRIQLANDPDVHLKGFHDALVLWMYVDVVDFVTVEINLVKRHRGGTGVVEDGHSLCQTRDGLRRPVERPAGEARNWR